MKRILFIFLLVFTLSNLFGFTQTNDSLQRIINAMPNDTNKVNKMLGLMYFYQNSSKETAIDVGHQALNLSKQMKWPLGKAKINEKIGRVYWSYGKYDSALHYHFIAAWQFNKLNLWKDYWDVIVMIGQDYANASQYDKAIFYLNASLNEYKIKKVEGGVSYVLGILAWVYGAKGDIVGATKNNIEQIKIAEKSNDSNALRFAYFALASNYSSLNRQEEAEKIIDSWYPYLIKNNNLEGLLSYYIDKASYVNYKNKLDSAFYFYNKEKEIACTLKNNYWIADAFKNIGNLNINVNNYTKALSNFDSAYYYFKLGNQHRALASVNCRKTLCLIKLGKANNAKLAMEEAQFYLKTFESNLSNLEFYEAKYKFDSATNNGSSAFKYYYLLETLKDSLFNEANTKQMLEIQIRYEADKREELLKQKNERTIMFLVILAIVTIIIIVFLVVLYLKNQKIKKANAIQITMLNEIHHRVKNNLQLISGFMQIQLNKTNDLKGREALEESINNINVVSLVHENLHNKTSDLVKLNEYVTSLCANLSIITNLTQHPKTEIYCDEIMLSIDQTIPIGLIINELITNSIKHAFVGSKNVENTITINILQKNKIINFSYSDNGIGFNEKDKKNSSIGMKLVKMLVQELQGDYLVNGKNGFEFELTFNNRKKHTIDRK
ncbi:MAG: tetratricopeptide repeat-containing sensor histidine kinase [Bacteroidia bacterium]